jgi:hypothetical protein
MKAAESNQLKAWATGTTPSSRDASVSGPIQRPGQTASRARCCRGHDRRWRPARHIAPGGRHALSTLLAAVCSRSGVPAAILGWVWERWLEGSPD